MRPSIVITGAASGIGYEIARLAARDDKELLLIDRAKDTLERVAAELRRRGARVSVLPIDLTNLNADVVVEDTLLSRDLYCDLLVNSAGLSMIGPACVLNRQKQIELFDVNVRALAALTLRFLPGMIDRRSGGVINIASLSSYMLLPNAALYNASKAFVRSFSSAVAAEASNYGVTISCVCPGLVKTPLLAGLQIKRGRVYKMMPRARPKDTARSAWVTFHAGKRVIFPGVTDRFFATLGSILPSVVIRHLVQSTLGASTQLRKTDSPDDSLKPAIVVTGASSGIGRELARVAAGDGYPLLLVARSREALEIIAAEITGRGAQVFTLVADLAAPNASQKIETALRERGLYADVIVNNAGICLAGPATEIPFANQMKLVDLNMRALTEITLRFVPAMVARGRGGVLNVGSLGAYMSAPNMAIYHASKAYVRLFSATLASELSGTGVGVTCLSPGVVRTPLVDRLPIRRTRSFKLVPKSHAVDVARAGWRGFRAGRHLVIPSVADRVLAAVLMILPHRFIPHVSVRPDAVRMQGQ